MLSRGLGKNVEMAQKCGEEAPTEVRFRISSFCKLSRDATMVKRDAINVTLPTVMLPHEVHEWQLLCFTEINWRPGSLVVF